MNITLHKKNSELGYTWWPITHCSIDDTNSFFAWPWERFDKNITEISDDIIHGLDNIKKFGMPYYLAPGKYTNITEINCNLSNLCYADRNFASFEKLNSFIGDLRNFTGFTAEDSMAAGCLFQYSTLNTFNANLQKLKCGYSMFNYCENLTFFYSSLASLANGLNMFNKCKLNSDSLDNISYTIQDVTNLQQDVTNTLLSAPSSGFKSITIGTGFTSEEEFENDSTALNAKSTIEAKGWEIVWQYNGLQVTPASELEPTGETNIIFVKKIEDINGEYKDLNSGLKYALLWGHKVSNPQNIDDWKIFSSIEEAMQYYQLEKLEEITEN